MKSHRILMHFSGIGAICFSGFMLLSIASQLIGLKFQFLPVGNLNPEEIVHIYQNSGFGIGVFLRFVAYVLLPLTFCGLFPYLYSRTPCLTRTGLVYGVVAYFFFLAVTFIEVGLVVSGGQGVLTSFAGKNELYTISKILLFLRIPTLLFLSAFLFFWGLSWRSLEHQLFRLGGWFFLGAAALTIIDAVFRLLSWQMCAGIAYIANVLLISLAFIFAGSLIFSEANKPAQKNS